MRISFSYFLQPLLLLTHFLSGAQSRSSDWSAKDRGIFFRDTTPFKIKGVSWFGMETCDYLPQGLWQHSMEYYLDFLQHQKFNAIRVPISEQWVKNDWASHVPNQGQLSADPSLSGKTSLQILDQLFDECQKRSIYILLDMHRLHCDAQSHEVWYTDDNQFTTDSFIKSWQTVIDRYAEHPAFHGIDLLNEPRGRAHIGGNDQNSWNLFVEQAFQDLNYDGLVYVEGVDWGHDLSGIKEHPLKVDPSRVVYSPHVYGPSVVGGTDLNPVSMRNHWDHIFGFLVKEGKTVVIGEVGGRYTGDDKVWQDHFTDYLVENNLKIFAWCLPPSSSDTGGLLADDWTTPMWDKLKLLERIEPYPTRFAPHFDPPQNRHLRGHGHNNITV